MNTAQVSIELVLAGILALSAFALPFFPDADLNSDLLKNEALIGILGLAYLLGVIFDKLADTILHPMEHTMRLRQAAKYLDEHPDFAGKDSYPQNKLEFNMRKSKDGRLDWMNSLKSRIRASRELAVMGLPATMGIVLHQIVAPPWFYIPVTLNLLAFIVSAWLESNSSDEGTGSARWRIKRIKTHDLKKDEVERNKQLIEALGQARRLSIPYYLLIAVPVCTIGLLVALNPDNTQILIIGLAGTILSLFALWTCLQITRTYIRFVAREMSGYLKEKAE